MRCSGAAIGDERAAEAKTWRFERLLTEHAFDKLRQIDRSFAEFAEVLEQAEVIEEHQLDDEQAKELVLAVNWARPLVTVQVPGGL